MNDSLSTTARKDVLTWDSTFMSLAMIVARRSKDPSTQVGAAIVDPDHRILSLGYNGAPIGFNDDEFPWGKTAENPLNNKGLYVVHSERNAILNYRGSSKDLESATLYVTLFPCNECAKEIIQSGIKHIVYADKPSNMSDEFMASERLLTRCGITIRKYQTTGKTVTIDI